MLLSRVASIDATRASDDRLRPWGTLAPPAAETGAIALGPTASLGAIALASER
jgi:hypothetical protein